VNDVCNVLHKSDKARAFKGKQGTTSGVDLMIVDIPEGLPIPMVSSSPTSVPEWNFDDKNFLAVMFDFGSSLVHDNGVLLLFHKDDLKLRVDITTRMQHSTQCIFTFWGYVLNIIFILAQGTQKNQEAYVMAEHVETQKHVCSQGNL
jgi:hypothetical protein